ncbi:MAG: hypothetical protein ACI9K2_007191 [Myxococcota bacterium]|jgi:hypothetical protein
MVPIDEYDMLVQAAGADAYRLGNPGGQVLRLWDWVQVDEAAAFAGRPRPTCAVFARRWSVSKSSVSVWMRENAGKAIELADSLGLKVSLSEANGKRTATERQANAGLTASEQEAGEEAGEVAPKRTATERQANAGLTATERKAVHARRANPNPTPNPTKTSAADAAAPGGKLSGRSRKALQGHGLSTIAHLVEHSPTSLGKLSGVGSRTVAEVVAMLAHHGRELRPDPVSPGKLAHGVRAMFTEVCDQHGYTYKHTPGDIHRTSPHVAEAFPDPVELRRAVEAYVVAVKTGKAWPANDPPSLSRFAAEATKWAAECRPPADTRTPGEIVKAERERMAAARKRRYGPKRRPGETR